MPSVGFYNIILSDVHRMDPHEGRSAGEEAMHNMHHVSGIRGSMNESVRSNTHSFLPLLPPDSPLTARSLLISTHTYSQRERSRRNYTYHRVLTDDPDADERASTLSSFRMCAALCARLSFALLFHSLSVIYPDASRGKKEKEKKEPKRPVTAASASRMK